MTDKLKHLEKRLPSNLVVVFQITREPFFLPVTNRPHLVYRKTVDPLTWNTL